MEDQQNLDEELAQAYNELKQFNIINGLEEVDHIKKDMEDSNSIIQEAK